MPDFMPGYTGQATQPSAAMGQQPMSAEQKLQSMMQAMGGAPNAVLMMIARILKSGESAPPQGPASNAVQMGPGWEQLYPMPPAGGPIQFPGVNSGDLPAPMRPTEPPRMMTPSAGFIRG